MEKSLKCSRNVFQSGWSLNFVQNNFNNASFIFLPFFFVFWLLLAHYSSPLCVDNAPILTVAGMPFALTAGRPTSPPPPPPSFNSFIPGWSHSSIPPVPQVKVHACVSSIAPFRSFPKSYQSNGDVIRINAESDFKPSLAFLYHLFSFSSTTRPFSISLSLSLAHSCQQDTQTNSFKYQRNQSTERQQHSTYSYSRRFGRDLLPLFALSLFLSSTSQPILRPPSPCLARSFRPDHQRRPCWICFFSLLRMSFCSLMAPFVSPLFDFFCSLFFTLDLIFLLSMRVCVRVLVRWAHNLGFASMQTWGWRFRPVLLSGGSTWDSEHSQRGQLVRSRLRMAQSQLSVCVCVCVSTRPL